MHKYVIPQSVKDRVVKRQGKLYLEAEIEEAKLVGKLDAKVFAKP